MSSDPQPTPGFPSASRAALAERLRRARRESDALFALIHPAAMSERPVPERHRLIFYRGHLEAFDWNLVGRQVFDAPSETEEFDRLFAFGIDPVGTGLPEEEASAWPALTEVAAYVGRCRARVDACVMRNDPRRFAEHWDVEILSAAIEHRLMHVETLSYLVDALPLDRKHPPSGAGHPDSGGDAPGGRWLRIPAGSARLGQGRAVRHAFGWDNEFEECEVAVPRFEIESLPVTNAAFLQFVENGGYAARELWSDADWEWVRRTGRAQPHRWMRTASGWRYRASFAELPLPLAWPAMVTHAEAAAFARWRGTRLPTEAEWHRAALSSPDSTVDRRFPWGHALPSTRRGNFGARSWDPRPVGSFPAGRSAFGAEEMTGNGWEWTSTPFHPFPGFRAYPFYPGYSEPFFDGKHYVMKGASPRTPLPLLRSSFRNWFQPHYPYVASKFRCVREPLQVSSLIGLSTLPRS